MAGRVTVRFTSTGISRPAPVAYPPYYWLVGDGSQPLFMGVRQDVVAPMFSGVFTVFFLIYVMVALSTSSVREYTRPATFRYAPNLVWLWFLLAFFVYGVFVSFMIRQRYFRAGVRIENVRAWTGAVMLSTVLFVVVLLVAGLATPAFEYVPWIGNVSAS